MEEWISNHSVNLSPQTPLTSLPKALWSNCKSSRNKWAPPIRKYPRKTSCSNILWLVKNCKDKIFEKEPRKRWLSSKTRVSKRKSQKRMKLTSQRSLTICRSIQIQKSFQSKRALSNPIRPRRKIPLSKCLKIKWEMLSQPRNLWIWDSQLILKRKQASWYMRKN